MVDWHAKSPEYVRDKLARGEALSWRERKILEFDEQETVRKRQRAETKAEPEPFWPTVWEYVRQSKIDWRKTSSTRVWIGAAIPAIIIGALLRLVWEPLVYLWIPIFIVWWLFLVLDPTHVLYCPYCRKRVKMGAATCHRCGRDVVPEPGDERYYVPEIPFETDEVPEPAAKAKLRPSPKTRPVDVLGDEFMAVVGESYYRQALDDITGGDVGVFEFDDTLLVRDPHNQHDPNAIRIECDGRHVGHLSRENAERFCGGLDRHGGVAACRAIVRLADPDHHWNVVLQVDYATLDAL